MRRTLGIKLGWHEERRGQMAIGWALLKTPNRDAYKGGEVDLQGVDPAAAALSLALTRKVKLVTLTTYITNEAFRRSRPWKEGLTLDEHRLLIARSAQLLRGAGIAVEFKEKR